MAHRSGRTRPVAPESPHADHDWDRPERTDRRAGLLGSAVLFIVVLSAVLLLDQQVTPSADDLQVQAPAQPREEAEPRAGSIRVRSELTVQRGLPYQVPFALDVWSPAGSGPFPVAVLLHGRSRDRAGYNGLVRRLTSTGTVVYNVTWHDEAPQLASDYHAAVGTIACAVRFARATADQFGGRDDAVTLIGHDLGASVGAAVAIAGERFLGPCPIGRGSARPDSFIGIAGFYEYTLPGPEAALLAVGLLDSTRGDARGPIPMVLVHGADDSVVPRQSARRFKRTLQQHGYPAELILAPRTRHENVIFSRAGLAAILRALSSVQDRPALKAGS